VRTPTSRSSISCTGRNKGTAPFLLTLQHYTEVSGQPHVLPAVFPKKQLRYPCTGVRVGLRATTASPDGVVKWEISAPVENWTLILWSLKFLDDYIAHYLKLLFWTSSTIKVFKTTTFQIFLIFLSSDEGINSAGSLGRATPCFESSSSNLKMETEPISETSWFWKLW
jgi:hypothetical protein